jgi:hypothetical protein
MRESKLFPPRKSIPQIGVFIRTAKGSVIEFCQDTATEDDMAFALALLDVSRLPPPVVQAVRTAVEDEKKPKKG